MIHVQGFTFNPFMENTFVLYDDTKECVIVDPGCYETDEREALFDLISKEELTPVKLINTHCHLDHVLGNKAVAEKYDIGLYINPEEKMLLDAAPNYAPAYGFRYDGSPEPTGHLKEGEILTFGDSAMDIIFAPGHSPGHVALYAKEEGILIGGDILFEGGIGRTDLPGGDHATLIRNIKEKVLTLPGGTTVYPGHGGATTVDDERRSNPFLQ